MILTFDSSHNMKSTSPTRKTAHKELKTAKKQQNPSQNSLNLSLFPKKTF